MHEGSSFRNLESLIKLTKRVLNEKDELVRQLRSLVCLSRGVIRTGFEMETIQTAVARGQVACDMV